MIALKRILDLLVTGAAWVAGIATALMMIHVTVDVIGRTVFHAPLTGTVEIVSAYHMAALAFLPLAYITRERGHIVVELFTGWMDFKLRNLTDGFVAIISIIYVATFTWKAIEIAIDKTEIREAKEAGTGFVEIWPSRWVVAIGFGLMAIYLVINMVQDLHAGFTGKGDPDAPGGDGADRSKHIPATEEQL